MKAVVFHGPGNKAWEEVPKPVIVANTDASNIYTADPTIGLNDLVALADPDGLFFPDNIAPVVSDPVSADARAVVTNVSEALTQTELVRLNALSVIDQMSSADIARQWLTITRLNR